MSEQKFCPECGTKVKADAAFCPNCGHKLTGTANENQAVSSNNTNQKDTASTTSKVNNQQTAGSNTQSAGSEIPTPSTNNQLQRSKPGYGYVQKKNHKKAVAIIAVLIVLVVGYLGLKNYYQPQNQLNRIITAFGDPHKNLAPYISTTDPTLQKKISKKNLKPVQKYFSLHKQKLSNLKSSLENGSTYMDSFTLEKSGNAWLLFPKYKVNVKATYVKLRTNHENVTFYQDGKKLAKTTSNKLTKNIGPLFPGEYTFKSTGVISSKKLTNVKNVILTAGSQDLSLKLHTINFTVNGQRGATVYLNNKKSGQLNDNGKMSFKNYPVNGSLKVYLTISVSNKTLKSETVNVVKALENSDHRSHNIYPGFKGVVSKYDAKELLSEAFSGTESGSDDSNTADLFTGSENNASYNNLVKFFASFNNNDNISSYDVNISKINSITPAGKNKATVSYSVKYRFHTTDDSGNDNVKVQQFTYPNAVIVKHGQNFKIQTIGKTSAKADWEKDYTNDDN